jgi:periplasmic protein CpxP/Spy
MKLARISVLAALALSGLVAFAPLLRAQDSKDDSTKNTPSQSTCGQRPRRTNQQNQFDRMAQQLKLTDEQKTKLQPIVKEENTKLRELRQDTSLTTEQRREKSRELRDQYTAKIKPILTAEQFEQYKKMGQQGGGRGQRAGGGAQGGNSNTQK